VARAGLGDRVEVHTAGTGDWHVGHPMDRRAAAVLAAAGLDASAHRARQFDPAWFERFDLVLAMDAANRADLAALCETLGADAGAAQERVRMFRDFDPLADDADRDVPDPYYGGDEGFDTVMAMVQRTADRLVAWLEGQLLGSEAR